MKEAAVWKRDFARDGQRLTVSLRARGGGRFTAVVGACGHEIEAHLLPDGRVRLTLDGRSQDVDAALCGKRLQVRVAGRTWILDSFVAGQAAAAHGSGAVEAPMTGTVAKVLVEPGARVEAGTPLVVLSAMKMEHRLAAGVAGVVSELRARVGQIVEQGELLATVTPDAV